MFVAKSKHQNFRIPTAHLFSGPATATLLIVAIFGAGNASAQSPGAAASSADDAQLAEIVVSARKRKEALSDIPGSVSVITEDIIQEIGGLIDPLQLGELLPGLTVEDEGLPEYKARGAGVATTNLADPSMVVLRNGVNVVGGFGGRTMSRIDQFDTNQIELYRGAQGSMFGRNAVGGVINVANNLPNENVFWSGQASLGFDKQQRRAEGILNVPLIDERLFLRTGIQYGKEKGLYHNDFLNEPALPQESIGMRVGLRALFSEATDATLFVDYEYFENENFIDSGTRRSGVAPETFMTVGAVDIRGQPLPATSPFSANAPYDEYRSAVDTAGFYRQKLLNFNLTVNHSLPFAVLQSVTSYRDRNFDTTIDGDGSYVGGPSSSPPTLRAGLLPGVNATSNAVCTRTVTNAQRQFTSVITARQCINSFDTESTDLQQEFRLVSPSDRRLQWLAGIDYRDFENPILEVRDGRFPNVTGTGQFYNYRSDAVLSNRTYGIYLSADYDLTTKLNVAGSVRYSKERKGIELQVFQTDAAPQLETAANENFDFESVDPTITLSYKMGNQMLYAAAARAARAGGYNRASGSASAPAAIAGINVPLRYEDEEATTYEVGLKGELSLFDAPLRYGITGYEADYKDILRNAVVLAGGNSGDADTVILGSQLVNIGDARVRGLDAEVNGVLRRFLWTKGDLRWNLGYTLADSEILSGPAAGQKLQDLPRTGYNANLSFRMPMQSRGADGVNAFIASLTGEYYSAKTPSTSSFPVDPRRRLNGRFGFTGNLDGKPWQLTLFVDNILDFDDIVTRASLNTYEGTATVTRQLVRRTEPRTFGIRFSMSSSRGGRGLQ